MANPFPSSLQQPYTSSSPSLHTLVICAVQLTLVVSDLPIFPIASPVSLGFSSFSPSLTSSEDEDDEAGLKGRLLGTTTRWRRLGAVKETGNSEEDQENDEEEDEEGEDEKKKTCSSRSDGETGVEGEGEGGEGPWRYKEFGKEYEPLKSVQLLKNLRSLSLYLPAHSIASDTDTGEM